MSWPRRRPLRALGALLLALGLGLVVLLNVLAYRQARSMTHFHPAGTVSRLGRSRFDLLSLLFNGLQLEKSRNRWTPFDAGLGYETVALEAADGTALEGWWIPNPHARATAVILHGYANCKGNQLFLAQQLYRRGLALLLVDFRGHGGSAGFETSVGYHESQDAAAAIAFARRRSGDHPVIGYGISMGAAALMRAVYTGEADPDALVLEAPFNRFVDTIANRFDSMGVPSFPTANLLVFYGGLLTDCEAGEHDPVRYAGAVRQPTLILQGERDRRVTVPQAQEVLAGLASEDKTLHVFPGLGHQAFVRADRAAWRDTLAPFLERVLPAGS